MTDEARGTLGSRGILVARIVCAVVAISPLIAAAVAAPTVDLSAPPVERVVTATVKDEPVVRTDAALRRAERQLHRRLDRIGLRTRFAVSLRDEKTGATFHHGSGRFRTASLVKVHFAALMLWHADRDDVPLRPQQRADIEQMLVRSANDPASRAYRALGGPAAIQRDLAFVYGITGIQVGPVSWGLSTTRPRDVVDLLSIVLSDDSRQGRRYALLQDAMSRVIPEQHWGITLLSDPGSRPQVKVGWVPTRNGWVVNSSGRAIVDGAPVLVSVMTDNNASLESGIATIEQVVRSLKPLVKAQRAQADALNRAAAQPELCFSAEPSTSPCSELP